MITRDFEITLRIPETNHIPNCFQVTQNDKDVYNLEVHITDGVNEINYAQVSSATITFSKADGNVVQGDMSVGVDSLTYTMGTNEIAHPGPVLASVQLFGADGERLTSARFRFNVVKDLITPSAVQSTSEFSILQQLKKDLEAIDVVDLTNQFNAHKAESATEFAIIKKVSSLQLENLVTNGDFSDGATGWVKTPAALVVTVVNNECTFTPTAQHDRISQPRQKTLGTKRYCAAMVKTTSQNVYMRSYNGSVDVTKKHSGSGQYELLSYIVTEMDSLQTTYGISIREDGTSGFVPISIKNVLAIDLTATFGAGNEPTKEEMDKALEYYPKSLLYWIPNKLRALEAAILAIGGS